MSTDKSLIKSITRPALVTAVVLMMPLAGMQFTEKINWTYSDFIFAGALLYGTGLAYNLVTRVLAAQAGKSSVYRVAVGFALFTGLFLVWVNLAVGIIGSENNPVNLLFYIVIFIGAAGALLARFRPQGMAVTFYAMAATQALIAIIVITGGYYKPAPGSVTEIVGVNGFFAALFIAAALLFRYAREEQETLTSAVQ